MLGGLIFIYSRCWPEFYPLFLGNSRLGLLFDYEMFTLQARPTCELVLEKLYRNVYFC